MSDKSSVVTIEAVKRTGSGKTVLSKLRKEGKMPGVVNHKGQSTPIQFDPKMLSKAWVAGRQFNLTLDGKTRLVKITELQLDPVKRLALHVDLAYAD